MQVLRYLRNYQIGNACPRASAAGLLAMCAVAAVASEHPAVAEIRPLLDRYCVDCHAGAEAESGIDYATMATIADFAHDADHLPNMLWVLEEGEMPPVRAEAQPTRAERAALVAWTQGVLAELENATPGDPGVVVMPRLTHLQYDRVIEQLTGQRIEAASLLPRDASSHAGFITDGAHHTVSPEHIEAYLEAAARVLSHARVTPLQGLSWHASPPADVAAPAAWRKELVDEWVSLHRIEEERLFGRGNGWSNADVLALLWRWRHREALGIEQSLPELARSSNPAIPGHTARLWWERLHPEFAEGQGKERLIFEIYRRYGVGEWFELPGPDAIDLAEVRERCADIQERISDLGNTSPHWNSKIEPEFDLAAYREEHDGTAPESIHLVFTAGGIGHDGLEMRISEGAFIDADGGAHPFSELHDRLVSSDGREFVWGEGGEHLEGESGSIVVRTPVHFELPVPAGMDRVRVRAAFAWGKGPTGMTQVYFAPEAPSDAELEFAYGRKVMGPFVNHAYNAARFLAEGADKTRNYDGGSPKFLKNQNWIWFNDYEDLPLRYLDSVTWPRGPTRGEPSPEEIDAFIAELQEESASTPRMLRARHLREEFSPAGAERLAVLRADLRLAAQVPHRDLRDLLHEHGHTAVVEGQRPDAELLAALPAAAAAQARELLATIDEYEAELRARAREPVATVAAAAFGRPVAEAELERLLGAYDAARAIGLSFDASVKQALKAVLISPAFLYREPLGGTTGGQIAALDDAQLAERLAYLLWGRGPDADLRELAAAGELRDPAVLAAQARRLLGDQRSRALAIDFLGYWLGFAEFDQHSRPNPERFPAYAELRDEMYEEAIRFAHHVFSADRPLTELIDADYTFADRELAEFYGMQGVGGDEIERVTIPPALRDQRGGIFGMAALLTKTSSALRTSPVLRGAWIVTAVMGEPMPEPPPDVPMLSQDETDDRGRSIAEQLAEHRENPACAACHQRIDPPGIALEAFDPIGRWRETYRGGEPVDDASTLADGTAIHGLADLRAYAMEHREQFLRTLCSKFASYGLGRQLTFTDRALIDDMLAALADNEFRASAMVEAFVTSKQFRNRRDLAAE